MYLIIFHTCSILNILSQTIKILIWFHFDDTSSNIHSSNNGQSAHSSSNGQSVYAEPRSKTQKESKIRNETTQKKWSTAQKNVCFDHKYSEMFVSFLYMNMFCAVHAIRRPGDLMKNPPLTLDWFHDVLCRPLLPIRTNLMEQQATQNWWQDYHLFAQMVPNVRTPKLWAQVKNFLSPRITSTWSSLAPLFLVFQDAPFSGEV